MADKQLLLKQNADDGMFAEDDPLAELARIVDFAPQAEKRPKVAADRREPEFDLEDELLKGFEQYEAAPEVVVDRAASAAPAAFVPVDDQALVPGVMPEMIVPDIDIDDRDIAPAAARHDADIDTILDDMPLLEEEPAPLRPQADLRAVPETMPDPVVSIARPQHPVFDLEDEILREFASFDARRAEVAVPALAPVLPVEVAHTAPASFEQPMEPASDWRVPEEIDPVGWLAEDLPQPSDGPEEVDAQDPADDAILAAPAPATTETLSDPAITGQALVLDDMDTADVEADIDALMLAEIEPEAWDAPQAEPSVQLPQPESPDLFAGHAASGAHAEQTFEAESNLEAEPEAVAELPSVDDEPVVDIGNVAEAEQATEIAPISEYAATSGIRSPLWFSPVDEPAAVSEVLAEIGRTDDPERIENPVTGYGDDEFAVAEPPARSAEIDRFGAADRDPFAGDAEGPEIPGYDTAWQDDAIARDTVEDDSAADAELLSVDAVAQELEWQDDVAELADETAVPALGEARGRSEASDITIEPASESVQPAQRWPGYDTVDTIDAEAADAEPLQDMAEIRPEFQPDEQDLQAEQVQPARPAESVVVPHTVATSAVAAKAFDALLDDVERYPVSRAPRAWQPLDKPIEPAPIPVLRPETRIPPVATAAALTHHDSVLEPENRPDVSVAPDNRVIPDNPAKAAEPVSDRAPTVEDHSAVEAFDENAFELDLSEIELDILEMEAESLNEAADRDDIVVAALAELASAEVVSKAPAPRSVLSAVPPVQAVQDYASLPFDPTQVTTEDEPLQALSEMDVPEVQVVDHAAPVAAQPEYEIDIDAEMAHLFSRPAPSQERPVLAATPAAARDTTVKTTIPAAELDEFERALEEDFRRSLTENRTASTPDRVPLTPASYAGNGAEGRGGRRLLFLAASVAALVVIGGAGVYGYMKANSPLVAESTEPKTILADNEPVKIVPENKGGQTVPNQDKAVYDRVSGEDPGLGKQERLVSSSEEPVDVVQKTLMPENLPMDIDEQAAATPTGDTADPRLLPEGQDENITTTQKVVSGVSPRKVRTMVVRSDGTLVAREELAPDDPALAAPVVEDTAKTPAKVDGSTEATPVVEVPERLGADNNAIVPAETTDQASRSLTTAEDAVAKAIETAPAVDEAAPVVEEAAPVAEVETPVVADAKPVETVATPDAEPEAAAADPVVPVQQEEVAQPAVIEAEALQKAAAADVQEEAPVRPVKTTKITANTPVPEVRPAEQPVDIVGTVTDQGTVRTAEREVASVDPVQPVAETAAANTTVAAGSYVIQIASLPSEQEAKSSYAKLSSKFASVIGGRGVDIRRAEIKNKGTYYRVRIPAGSRQEAATLCARYKQAGGSCLVSR